MRVYLKNYRRSKSLSEGKLVAENRIKLVEDKNRFIDKLNITDEQKEELKAFFKKHPNYEGKIDWNKKDLTYNDFKELLATEGNTKSSVKKYGLSGQSQIEDLTLDKDYKIIKQSDSMTIYYPLTFKGSEVLAKPTTPPLGVTGKWCIAGKNYSPGTQDQHWNNYTSNGIDFFFIFLNHSKWAVARYPDNQFEVFDQNDNERQWDAICDVDEYHQNFYKFPWDVEEMCEVTPRYLPEALFKVDEYGNKWSSNGKELVKVGENLPVLIVPEGTEIIKWRAANHRTQLKKLIIPDNVTIQDEAFAYCWGLTEIQLGKNIKTDVSTRPFDRAGGKVSFAEGTTEIPGYLFTGSNISQVFIPETVSEIGNCAFQECERLESINLPRNLEKIGMWAFSENHFDSIALPSGLEYLGDFAFYNSYNLKEINIPGSVWVVRNGLLRDCGELEKVKFGWGIEKIGRSVFDGCSELKEIYFPGSLEEISSYAFKTNYRATNFKELKIWFSGTPERFKRLTEDDDLRFLRDCFITYTDQFYNTEVKK